MQLWRYRSHAWGARAWKGWLSWAMHSRLDPVLRVAWMIRPAGDCRAGKRLRDSGWDTRARLGPEGIWTGELHFDRICIGLTQRPEQLPFATPRCGCLTARGWL